MAQAFRQGFGLVLAAIALSVIAPASALAAAEDNFEDAVSLDLGIPELGSNVGFGVQPPNEVTTCNSISFKSTAWYTVQGTGRPMTLSSGGSNFDTVMSLYRLDPGPTLVPRGCDDDKGSSQTSELSFTPNAGATYYVQLGGCVGNSNCGRSEGNIEMTAAEPPANDARSAATPITIGNTYRRNNLGATTASTESSMCGSGRYGRSVWFRFTTPRLGKAIVNVRSTGMDPVVQVFAGSATTGPCQDDAPGETLSASLPMNRIPAGTYYVQIGGFDNDGGNFDVDVNWVPILDADGDGVNAGTGPGQDCDDTNAAIKPGADEIPNNDVDENCDGIKAFNRDGDPELAPPAGSDCDDNDPNRYHGNREIAGDGKDQDCDGRDQPLPVLTARFGQLFIPFKTYTLVNKLSVRAPRGSKVTIRCTGSHCPFRTKRLTTKKSGETSLLGKLKKRERKIPVGRKLEVSVSKSGFQAKARRYTMRRSNAPSYTDWCGSGSARKRC